MLHVPQKAAYVPSLDFVRRIRKSYRAAIELRNEAGDSVLWAQLIPMRQADLHSALTTSETAARNLLSDMRSHNLYYGADHMCRDLQGGKPAVTNDRMTRQLLIALAEAVGVLDVWNPEGGSRFPTVERPDQPEIADFLEGLDQAFGVVVSFPDPFACESGYQTPRGIASLRAVHALYQAYRMRQASILAGGCRMLEIGGGTGRTAYYASVLGLTNYTVIDIPMGMVRQACFLAATLGEEAIWLYGEPEVSSASVIKVAPPPWLLTQDLRFDVALNADSLTEMGQSDAAAYVQFLRKNTRCFISINHEANAFSAKQFWHGMWRFRYPLRDGYLEEIGFNLS